MPMRKMLRRGAAYRVADAGKSGGAFFASLRPLYDGMDLYVCESDGSILVWTGGMGIGVGELVVPGEFVQLGGLWCPRFRHATARDVLLTRRMPADDVSLSDEEMRWKPLPEYARA